MVWSDIVHPVYSDFYLQSQAGLKGSTSAQLPSSALHLLIRRVALASRPSHYTVIKATGFTIDQYVFAIIIRLDTADRLIIIAVIDCKNLREYSRSTTLV